MEREEQGERVDSDDSWANYTLDLHPPNFFQNLLIFKRKHFIQIFEVCVIKCQHTANASQDVFSR